MRVHIGATWRIRLNRPCAATMRPMSNYFDHLFYLETCTIQYLVEIVLLCLSLDACDDFHLAHVLITTALVLRRRSAWCGTCSPVGLTPAVVVRSPLPLIIRYRFKRAGNVNRRRCRATYCLYIRTASAVRLETGANFACTLQGPNIRSARTAR